MKILTFGLSIMAMTLFMAVSLMPEICSAQTSTNSQSKKWGLAVVGQSISIWATKPKYRHGEEIKICQSIKNVGSNEVRFASAGFNAADTYDALVQKDGQPNLPTTEGSQLIKSCRYRGGSLSVEILKPGEEDTLKGNRSGFYPLSQIYDLSIPGTYKVKLTRELINPQPPMERVSVTSNEIEIVIE